MATEPDMEDNNYNMVGSGSVAAKTTALIMNQTTPEGNRRTSKGQFGKMEMRPATGKPQRISNLIDGAAKANNGNLTKAVSGVTDYLTKTQATTPVGRATFNSEFHSVSRTAWLGVRSAGFN